jgi:hypothetical protein
MLTNRSASSLFADSTATFSCGQLSNPASLREHELAIGQARFRLAELCLRRARVSRVSGANARQRLSITFLPRFVQSLGLFLEIFEGWIGTVTKWS